MSGETEYVDVTIGTDGAVKVETTGFSGEACFNATRELEAALGKRGVSAKKPEYQKSERAVRKAGGIA